jgi:Arc/MetJ family transcription regulator
VYDAKWEETMEGRRFSVTLDPDLLDNAVRLSGADSQREAIEIALREFVRRRGLERMARRAGSVALTISVEEVVQAREAE